MVKDCNCKNCECKEREAFLLTFEDGLPFTDEENEGFVIRTFSKEIEPHLLKWHSDEEDRVVYPLNGNDWQFQFDNSLPFNIVDKIEIPKGVFHRIIKGTTDLILKIEK